MEACFILMSDIEAAHALSLFLRKKEFIPSLFRDEHSFFQALSRDLPSFVLIDTKLFKGEKIQKISLPTLLFSKDSSPPTCSPPPDYLGVIYGDLALSDQFDLILGERSKVIKPIEALKEIKAIKAIKETKLEAMTLDSFLEGSENCLSLDKFWRLLEEFIHDQDEVTDFSLVYWNRQFGGIESPHLRSTKYRLLPRVKTGQVMQKGIEFFAQNMAIELAIDILGEKFLSLPIRSEYKNPEIIIYLKLKEAITHKVPWKIFSHLLSGIYFKLNQMSQEKKEKDFISSQSGHYPWDVLKELSLGSPCYQIDFRPLIEFLKDHTHTPFNWNFYYKDFIDGFVLESEYSTVLIPFGLHQMVFICRKESEEYLVRRMKKHIEDFKWQKYFQSNSIHKVDGVLPVLWKLPSNIWDFIRLLEN